MPAYTNDSGDSGGRRQLIVALVVVVAAVSVAFLPAPRQQQVAWAIRESALRPFVLVQEGLSVARLRATDAGALRRDLDSLVAVTSGHLALAAENRRLHALVGLRERIGAGWVSANVVRPGTAGSESVFVLDVGSEDGVERYAPVIAGQGVVGVVHEVHSTTSLAIDWTHPEFAVSAMDPQGIVYGIVRTRRGDFREADRLEFDGTAFQAHLEDGTVIVTSNLSGVWPMGIPIGKVAGVAEADAGWRKSYWLRPMMEVASMTHAMVAVSPESDLFGVWPVDSIYTDAELALNLEARQDSLQALGDSVRMLRALLAAPRPLRDSLFAALLIEDDGVLPSLLRTDGPAGAADSAPGRPGGSARSGDPPRSAPATPVPAPRPLPSAEPRGPLPAGGLNPGSTIPPFPRPTDTVQVRPPAGRGAPPPPDTLTTLGTGLEFGGTTVEGRTSGEIRIRVGGVSPR
jgi:rod shape-determining protein MreC